MTSAFQAPAFLPSLRVFFIVLRDTRRVFLAILFYGNIFISGLKELKTGIIESDMLSHRAVTRIVEDSSDSDEAGDEEVPEIIPTRYGYNVVDFLTNYQQVFLQHGTLGWGRILHLTADMICSDGYEKWRAFTYSYALDHIGLASPRIFVYLNHRHEEIGKMMDKYPTEVVYARPDFERAVSEVVLVLNTQPRRTRLQLPRVPVQSLGEFWIRSQKASPDTAAVRKCWRHSTDAPERALAANHILAACQEGATEKALFWMRWSIDEDKRKLKAKENIDMNKRGGGLFIARCIMEAYKDLAAAQKIRMHEEFGTLMEMYMREPVKGSVAAFTTRQRADILVLMIQILCEVPRWKVPAAVPLVKDDIALKLAANQAPIFFKEVLGRPTVEGKIWKYAKRRVGAGKPAEKKEITQEDQIDNIYKSFYKGVL